MDNRTLNIGLIQQANSENIEENISRLKNSIKSLASQGAELIVLQELHNSLYFCQTENVNNFDLAEPIPGPSTEAFSQMDAITTLCW